MIAKKVSDVSHAEVQPRKREMHSCSKQRTTSKDTFTQLP